MYLYSEQLLNHTNFELIPLIVAIFADLFSVTVFVYRYKENQQEDTAEPQQTQLSTRLTTIDEVEIPSELTRERDHILWLLYKNRNDVVSTSALSSAIGKSLATTSQHLKFLRNRDFVLFFPRRGWKITAFGINYIQHILSSRDEQD